MKREEDETDAVAIETATEVQVKTRSDSEVPTFPQSSMEPPPPPGVVRPLQRYRFEDVIGYGGMGEVVSAHDEQIGRFVAIKRMRTSTPSPDTTARFIREARIQGRLEHPAVVPVHELWYDEMGQPFFVMKQLAGTTLADVLAKIAAGDPQAEPFTRQRLLRAFAEVCLAIEFAHSRGIIHRDLKPSNIMLGDFGEVYVLDWGIARVMAEAGSDSGFDDVRPLDDGSTAAGVVFGTPGYMSPEQIRGDADLDGRADVYALGCILFEILAGEPLHPRGTDGLAGALAGVNARASARVPDGDVPPELDAICVCATAVERVNRYGSARRLGDAVQEFLDGDRDVALRRTLARSELGLAHEALERGNGAAERRRAIQAAARAVALDPTDREPVELLGRLMLEPPTEVPVEVATAVARRDLDAMYASRNLIGGSALATLMFIPLLIWAGLRVPSYLAVEIAIPIVIALTAVFVKRRWTVLAGRIALAGWVLMIGVLSVSASPFLLAPGVAVTVSMSIATHPAIIRPWLLVILMSAAVLGPWLVELAVGASSVLVVGPNFVLGTAATALDPLGARVGLATFVIVMIASAVILARTLTNLRRAAQRLVETQAWQLRQLMPR